MATWKADRSWPYDEACDGYTPGKVTWEYSTTSDILTLRFEEEAGSSWGGEIKARSYEELYGCARAEAVLAAMQDWLVRDGVKDSDCVGLRAQIDVLERRQEELESALAMAERKVEVGKALAQDLIRKLDIAETYDRQLEDLRDWAGGPPVPEI